MTTEPGCTEAYVNKTLNEAVKGTSSSAAFCLRAYFPAAEVLLLLNVNVMWPRDASIFLFLEGSRENSTVQLSSVCLL